MFPGILLIKSWNFNRSCGEFLMSHVMCEDITSETGGSRTSRWHCERLRENVESSLHHWLISKCRQVIFLICNLGHQWKCFRASVRSFCWNLKNMGGWSAWMLSKIVHLPPVFWGRCPIWLQCFSAGLKSPTSCNFLTKPRHQLCHYPSINARVHGQPPEKNGEFPGLSWLMSASGSLVVWGPVVWIPKPIMKGIVNWG